MKTHLRIATALVAALAVSACGGVRLGGSPATERPTQYTDPTNPNNLDTRNTIWSAFRRNTNEQTVLVNKYIWAASLEVLNFLPIQSVDPFTGVIVTGFGAPPNGGRAYRATILIDDPALDARSLSVALQTRGGAASPATVRAVEDAILTRARQLRIADNRL
ncbi:MAG: DUF3576 domain-containing protein [Pseudomonadota bacterium]